MAELSRSELCYIVLALICVALSASAEQCEGAPRYELEVVLREGDYVDGYKIVDLDLDDAPPAINSQGDIAFLAVTPYGESLFRVSTDGISNRLYSVGDTILRPGTPLRHTVLDFSEDRSRLIVSESGDVYHAFEDDDSTDFISKNDELVYGFDILDEYFDSFVFASAVFDQFGGIYLHGYPRTRDTYLTIKNGSVVAQSGQIDGHGVEVYSPHVSPSGYVAIQAKQGVFVDGRRVIGPGETVDAGTLEETFLADINDSGDVLFVGRVASETRSRLFANQHAVPLRNGEEGDGYQINTVYPYGTLTADGAAIVVATACRPECESAHPTPGLFMDGDLIVMGGVAIGEESKELQYFQRWSANERGDIIFNGRFGDGSDGIVLARRIIAEVPGDVNNDGAIDLADINTLSRKANLNTTEAKYDLNGDEIVDERDRAFWLHKIKGTVIGDANLDGAFDSSDIVRIFTRGEYEDEWAGNSTWLSGDWDGDGDFSSTDLVSAFQDGGYEQGLRTGVTLAPEPTGTTAIWIAALTACLERRRGTRGHSRV